MNLKNFLPLLGIPSHIKPLAETLLDEFEKVKKKFDDQVELTLFLDNQARQFNGYLRDVHNVINEQARKIAQLEQALAPSTKVVH